MSPVVSSLGLLPIALLAVGNSTPPDTSNGSSPEAVLGSVSLIDVHGYPDSISPDGQYLAGSNTDQIPCVWSMTSLTEPVCAAERLPVPEDRGRPSMQWAPDSQHVAFATDALIRAYDGDIHVMGLDGGVVNLTDDGYEGSMLGGDAPGEVPVDIGPVWSPDGEQIAFARSPFGDDSGPAGSGPAGRSTSILRVRAAGGVPTDAATIDAGTAFVVWPSMFWLDDGSIVYSRNTLDTDDPDNGVWRLQPDLTTTAVAAAGDSMALSDVHPDGRLALVADPVALGAVSYRPNDDPAVWALDLETGEVVPRPWLDVSAGALVPPPAESGTDSDTALAHPTGPQVFSPDGAHWFGCYNNVEGQYFVVGDTETDELVAVLEDPEREHLVGAVQPQWVEGGVLMKLNFGGLAVWFPISL